MKARYLILFGKFAHIIIPNYILMNILKKIVKLPLLGWRIASYFDPNLIRKFYRFNLKSKFQKLKGDRWELIVNTKDHIGFYSYLRDEPFEMSVFQIGNKLKESKRKIVIDVGANIGTASIPLCSRNNYELIAIEPSKANASTLLKNININKIKSRVFLCALTEENDSSFLKLNINNGNTGSNSLIKNWNPSKYSSKKIFEYVESKTFDEVIQNAKICIDDILVVKIDVEGMEELVLKGARKFLEVNSAPLILEYRKDLFEKYLKSDMSGLIKILENFNYRIYSLNNKGNLDEFNPSKKYENIIALSKNSHLNKLLI